MSRALVKYFSAMRDQFINGVRFLLYSHERVSLTDERVICILQSFLLSLNKCLILLVWHAASEIASGKKLGRKKVSFFELHSERFSIQKRVYCGLILSSRLF